MSGCLALSHALMAALYVITSGSEFGSSSWWQRLGLQHLIEFVESRVTTLASLTISLQEIAPERLTDTPRKVRYCLGVKPFSGVSGAPMHLLSHEVLAVLSLYLLLHTQLANRQRMQPPVRRTSCEAQLCVAWENGQMTPLLRPIRTPSQAS